MFPFLAYLTLQISFVSNVLTLFQIHIITLSKDLWSTLCMVLKSSVMRMTCSPLSHHLANLADNTLHRTSSQLPVMLKIPTIPQAARFVNSPMVVISTLKESDGTITTAGETLASYALTACSTSVPSCSSSGCSASPVVKSHFSLSIVWLMGNILAE